MIRTVDSTFKAISIGDSKIQHVCLGEEQVWPEELSGVIHLIGSFDSSASSTQRYVYINGQKYDLDTNFDFILKDTVLEYGKSYVNNDGLILDGEAAISYPIQQLIGEKVSSILVTTRFFYKVAIKKADLSGWNMSKVIDMQGMFEGCSELLELNIEGWKPKLVKNIQSMFFGCSKLTNLDLSGWDIKEIIQMNNLFGNCYALKRLNLSGWNVENVLFAHGMFYQCRLLEDLNLDGWNLKNVKDYSSMFDRCAKLLTLDLSNWNVNGASNISSMFYKCSNLTSINLNGWIIGTEDAPSQMDSVFYDCSSLTNLDLSTCSIKTYNISSICEQCVGLKTVNFANWDVSNVRLLYRIFYRCSILESINLSNWDLSGLTSNDTSAFYSCSKLANIVGPIFNIAVSLTFSYCPLTIDSAMVIINGLKDGVSGNTITFKSSTYDQLSADQIAIATAKGWSIVRS